MLKNKTTRPKPVVLIVLDGWGINQDYAGNAITQAKKPFFDSLVAEYPVLALRASGEAVGLPWGKAGNSEVGHLSLGLGRILYQDLPRINKSISDNTFYKKEALLQAVRHVKKNNSQIHFLGVVSDGCVHASIDHLHALLVLAKKYNLKKVYIHAILDGRDTSYNSGIKFIENVERTIKNFGIGKVATISGRFYAMDRNNNWDRTAKAYFAMTDGVGEKNEDSIKAIAKSYKKKIFDEEFMPTVISENGQPVSTINDNDAVIFYNFRPDRARQLTRAFILLDFNKFKRKKILKNLFFVTFTEYEKNLPVSAIVFPPEQIKNTLGEIISRAGLKQLRIAETEKYAHVTYFFNGGKEKKWEGEDHILIPSLTIPSYDAQPEMSAPTITKKLLEFIQKNIYDFILVNFANADMVGHTGNIQAAIKAVEILDESLNKIVSAVLSKKGIVLITADHGNADVMFNMQTGEIDKEHSTNPVPFIVVGDNFAGKNLGGTDAINNDLSLMQPYGILADVAPTVLKIMNLPKPKEMTGRSLV